MNTNDTTTDRRDNRALSLTAFILFLVGFFLPFLSLAFRFPDPLLFAALGAELLALIFGLMSWRFRLGKTAVIGAVVFFLVAIVNFIRFQSNR